MHAFARLGEKVGAPTGDALIYKTVIEKFSSKRKIITLIQLHKCHIIKL